MSVRKAKKNGVHLLAGVIFYDLAKKTRFLRFEYR